MTALFIGRPMKYEKTWLSYEQQADQLISRGMSCDRENLIEHLRCVSYYRLSGYWYPFQQNNHFKEGTLFSTVWNRYVFDRQFRLIVLDAIERVEVFIRTQLAYELAEAHGAFGFLEKNNLLGLNDQNYDLFISKAKDAYKSSRENFIKHFKKKYGESHDLPPYWVLVEIIDFGQMYRLYQGAPKPIQKKIAQKLGVEAVILDSWLKTLNVCRNICAHHARLWNKVLGVKPKIPERDERWQSPKIANDRVFAVLTILSYSLSIIAPDSSWRSKLTGLFRKYPNIPIASMGFLPGWEGSPFWKDEVMPLTRKI